MTTCTSCLLVTLLFAPFTMIFSKSIKDEIRLHQVVKNATEVRGRVEIRGEDTWHPLCAQLWTKNDAEVVCKTLGYLEGFLQATNDYSTRPKQGHYYLLPTGLGCQGLEEDVGKCQNWKKGIVITFYCPQGLAVAACKNNPSSANSLLPRTFSHYFVTILMILPLLHFFPSLFHGI